jgi:glucose-6-phosphate-specific signal transduction histidine kinase
MCILTHDKHRSWRYIAPALLPLLPLLKPCHASLKYHRLHPEYIHQRVEKMRNMYNVRILMVLCDIVSGAFPTSLRRASPHDGISAIPHLCISASLGWRTLLRVCRLESLTLLAQSEHQASLRELAKYAIINDYTMFVAWS